MRPDDDHLVEAQRRELAEAQRRELVEAQRRDPALGRALAELPPPELPSDMDERLRAAVEKELRRARRRPATIALVVLAVLLAAIGGLLAWRYVPPRATTMEEVRAAIETRRAALIPTPPEAAIVRGYMTAQERDALERQVTAALSACCTPRYALERIIEDDAVDVAVRAAAEQLADGAAWPAPVARQPLGDVVFVRRTWDGALLVRLDQPHLDRVGDRGDLFLFRRVDGRWLIDHIDHRGA